MNYSRAFLAVFVAALGLPSFTACSKKNTGEKHAHAHHHHTAPHGGTLVELGEHQFNLELVREETMGVLVAYTLDAHAENFIRSPLPAIPLIVTVNGKQQTLSLAATGSAETGETVGDTSAFVAQADWIKTTPSFDVLIPALEIRGVKFTDVKFNFPKGADDHDHDDDHNH